MKEEVLDLNAIANDIDDFDAESFVHKLKLCSNDAITNDLFRYKEFSKNSNALRIKELRSRGLTDSELTSLKADIDRNYQIRAANSTLSLTDGEKWRLMLFPLFFSRRLLSGFEKDGCDRKIEEYENSAFIRKYTSIVQVIPIAFVVFVALIVVDFVMNIAW